MIKEGDRLPNGLLIDDGDVIIVGGNFENDRLTFRLIRKDDRRKHIEMSMTVAQWRLLQKIADKQAECLKDV
ncbi:hypothetical protein PP301_gp068 [Gordonia phage GMA2]|uniref:Uncharacterized protein n=1 Tax=Gordonia phage GMA2 TaxID=1647283 RepID=A0A0K0N6U2_9CAUD|nr:hypothetical protein PP301_gp068 [Gordonia phage GMA2]AKJ72654.1 hypothetical protein GMA2_116 [Gordonia phage GMA2]